MTFKKIIIGDEQIQTNKWTVITGINGSGKTTLFNSLKKSKNITSNHKPLFFDANEDLQIYWTDEFEEYCEKEFPEINFKDENWKEHFAKSEQTILKIAELLLYKNSDSIVMDGVLSQIDSDKKNILIKFLKRTNKQAIIIELEQSIPKGMKIDFEITNVYSY